MRNFILAAAAIIGVALCGALSWRVMKSPEPQASRLIAVQRSPPGPLHVRFSPPPAKSSVVQARADPLDNDADQLFMTVRTERKDETWAAQAEGKLDVTLQRIPGIGQGRPLAIRCGASTCEVSGAVANNDDYDEVQSTWVRLRAAMQDPQLARAGIVVAGSTLGTARDVAGFVIYFRRQPS